jgi:putative SOS response-associated peptidase YedK
MCGRYAITLPPEAMLQVFGYGDQPNFPPRYNIAPTQPVPVVLMQNGARRFMLMRWGFVPGWVKDLKTFPLVINVRGETIREKPSFRAAFARRRCLMPADGFYEWTKDGRVYLFRRPDRAPFAFAAIHETWSSPDGSEMDTVALVNGPANGLMAAIHERCPVILAPSQWPLWLDGSIGPDEAAQLLKPPPDDLLDMLRIGTRINKVANDDAAVQEPWTPEPSIPEPIHTPPAPAKPRKKPGDDGQGSLF